MKNEMKKIGITALTMGVLIMNCGSMVNAKDLGRTPEYSETSYWLEAMDYGLERNDIITIFIECDEFYNRVSRYGL